MKPWQVYVALALALLTDRFFGLVGGHYAPWFEQHARVITLSGVVIGIFCLAYLAVCLVAAAFVWWRRL